MDVVLDQMRAPRELRIAARILGWPFKWLGYSGDPTLPPVLRAITALGPSYIKLGQILSTRPDFVGGGLALQLRFERIEPREDIGDCRRRCAGSCRIDRGLRGHFGFEKASVPAREDLALQGAHFGLDLLQPGIDIVLGHRRHGARNQHRTRGRRCQKPCEPHIPK